MIDWCWQNIYTPHNFHINGAIYSLVFNLLYWPHSNSSELSCCAIWLSFIITGAQLLLNKMRLGSCLSLLKFWRVRKRSTDWPENNVCESGIKTICTQLGAGVGVSRCPHTALPPPSPLNIYVWFLEGLLVQVASSTMLASQVSQLSFM